MPSMFVNLTFIIFHNFCVEFFTSIPICFSKTFQNYWDPSVLMEFCSQFFKYIANELNDVDSPYDVYRFDFDPINSEYVFLKTFKGKNNFSFLPEWYIKEVESMGTE